MHCSCGYGSGFDISLKTARTAELYRKTRKLESLIPATCKWF